jgi:hypothetical protein
MLILRFVGLSIMENINTYWIKKIKPGRRNRKAAE